MNSFFDAAQHVIGASVAMTMEERAVIGAALAVLTIYFFRKVVA